MIYLFLVLLYYCFIEKVNCIEKEITVNIDPLKEDCFYQTLKTSDSVEIEYQVIDGGYGDLDISFSLIDPTGRILVTDFKKSENSHQLEVQTDGDFRFCFDNSFSSFNSKTVFFELIVDGSDEDQWGLQQKYNFIDDSVDGRIVQDVQIEDIHEVVNNVRNHLGKARLLQDMIKSMGAKDQNIAEETYFKINVYSILILVIMIITGFIQLAMVKSLFDCKSKISQIWNYVERTYN